MKASLGAGRGACGAQDAAQCMGGDELTGCEAIRGEGLKGHGDGGSHWCGSQGLGTGPQEPSGWKLVAESWGEIDEGCECGVISMTVPVTAPRGEGE